MKFKLGIFLIFIVSFSLKAEIQKSTLDSLKTIWQNAENSDSTRSDAYHKYIWDGFLFSDPDSAFKLAEELLNFGRVRNYSKAQAKAYYLQGVSWHNRNNYPKAIDAYTNSLKIDQQIGDQKGIASSLNTIGLIYDSQKDYEVALDYYRKSLQICRVIEYSKGIANSLNNMGNSYFKQGKYKKALDYYNQSLTIRKQIDDKNGIATSLNSIGLIYENTGDYKNALDYYKQSLAIGLKIDDQGGVVFYLNNIGNIHFLEENYPEALSSCKEAYNIAKTVNVLEGEKHACRCLYKTYKEMGNSNMALQFLEHLNHIKDSLYAAETIKKLQQMEFDKWVFEDSVKTAKKVRLVQEAYEAEMRKKEQTRNISLGLGAILILLIGGLFTRVRFIRKSRAALQLEKDRSENLLLNILPEEIAQELKEKGKADARDYNMVSILFTDFKDFTEQSSKLSPVNLVNEMNLCFEAFDKIVEKHNIEKIKTIGDSYMAAGGLPIPTKDSVTNTVLAALEMQKFIESRHKTRGESAFQMRAGIHTGSVVAGIVGVKKFQYDIWGDTVNTASRMESNGEINKVNISQATYDCLKTDSQFSFESRGKITAKGKGDLEMYFVSRSLSER